MSGHPLQARTAPAHLHPKTAAQTSALSAIVLRMLPLLLAFAAPPQQVSLCEVMRRPATYRHRLITIPARIVLALPHGAFLDDEHCPDDVLPLGYDLPNADPSVTNLIPSILNNCIAGSTPYTAPGTFTGRLAYDANGRINLRLLSVPDLATHPCEPPKLSNPLFPAKPPTLPTPRLPST